MSIIAIPADEVAPEPRGSQQRFAVVQGSSAASSPAAGLWHSALVYPFSALSHAQAALPISARTSAGTAWRGHRPSLLVCLDRSDPPGGDGVGCCRQTGAGFSGTVQRAPLGCMVMGSVEPSQAAANASWYPLELQPTTRAGSTLRRMPPLSATFGRLPAGLCPWRPATFSAQRPEALLAQR